jgi:sulfate adenylyltransferase subunit 2
VAVEAIIGELAAAATPERSGRAQDKEEAFAMQKLRSLGYM